MQTFANCNVYPVNSTVSLFWILDYLFMSHVLDVFDSSMKTKNKKKEDWC